MVIDSHVHLWPQSMADESGHRWMTPGMPLAKEHNLADYLTAVQHTYSPDLFGGFIFVETDPRHEHSDSTLAERYRGPLDEIRFLQAEISKPDFRRLLVAAVIWAPLLESTIDLRSWLSMAQQVAGEVLWPRVRGFRYLLQDITDRARFEQLVCHGSFVENLKVLGQKNFAFDVGVDQHSGGIWQLYLVADAIKQAHTDVPDSQKVICILNHLCKPNFSDDSTHYQEWCSAMKQLSMCSRVFVKLSGAFSELPDSTGSAEDVAGRLKPWIQYLVEHFGPDRLMFGSDWPVCNLGGPSESSSWSFWSEIVAAALTDPGYALDERAQQRIWQGTALEAYGVE
ncbi:hypothetical protein AMS68_004615 [Peltaster fructicola]|uniref:Amidohydrolase-related domain-containing protein n=1 Tax=Peltaster fructicola TaxID=286661 RepID=A0A6H0XWX4_9PEZI|nr:hypothetical protein AMS68_004615 [Peltaster fructicola]